MEWCGMAWYGMAWYGVAWYGMVCHDMVCLAIPIQSLASHPIPTDLRWISFATPPILSFLREPAFTQRRSAAIKNRRE